MLSFRFGALGAFAFSFGIAAVSCGDSADDSAPEASAAAGGEQPNSGAGGSAPTSGQGNGGSVIGLGGVPEGGHGGEESCAKTTAEADFVPANFLFVIDTSGSMNCNAPDGDPELASRCARFPAKEDPSLPSKWEITNRALQNALGVLLDKPHVSAGLMLFPRQGECGVSAEPSVPLAALDRDHLAAMSAALDSVSPEGETPVAGATILSYAHLAERLRAGTLSGNSFVVLLTDGAETCAPSVLGPWVERDVPNARGFDIRTFVIGAPGSEAARPLLSRVAWEGGTAAEASCTHELEGEAGDCHLDMTTSHDFETELGAALGSIASIEALSCEVEVPTNPNSGGVDLNRVNVTFSPAGEEPESIVNDTADCDVADGWQYSLDNTKILLCGDACRRVQTTSGELSIVLGCPTVKVR